MNIDLIAELKTSKEFFELYKPEDLKKLFYNRSLIFYSVINHDLNSKYEISNFLLNEGVDALGTDSDGYTVLHLLLANSPHDFQKTADLCKRFIDLGVDVNVLAKDKTLAFFWIILDDRYNDEELMPLYKLFFAQPNFDLHTKGKWGLSLLDIATQNPCRKTLLKLMEEYL